LQLSRLSRRIDSSASQFAHLAFNDGFARNEGIRPPQSQVFPPSRSRFLRKSSTLEQLRAALENNFSIDDYLELRRRFPKSRDTALWMVMGADDSSPSYGMDFAYQLQADFKKFRIPIETFLGTLDGDRDYIDLLCLSTLEALSRREKLMRDNPHTVGSGLAIGDALVNLLCCAVLECLSYYSLPPPDSFQILLKYRLQMFDSSIKEQRVLDHRRVMIALFVAEHPSDGVREIARSTGLNASTISRWMADKEFMSYVKMFRAYPPRGTSDSMAISSEGGSAMLEPRQPGT
jgi:hypothetical protein